MGYSALVCDNQSASCDELHKSVTNGYGLLFGIIVYNILQLFGIST